MKETMPETQEIVAFLTDNDIDHITDARVCSPMIDSVVELVIMPKAEEMVKLLPHLHQEDVGYEVLGGGTNTLLMGTPDSPLKTVLVSTKKMRAVTADGSSGMIVAEAGTHMVGVARAAARAGLSGLEFACEIPGTVAGGVATDAWHPTHLYGAGFEAAGLDPETFPRHVSAVLSETELVVPDGEIVTMTADELEMKNRTSRLLKPENDLFLLRTIFALEARDPDDIARALDVIKAGRKAMRVSNSAKNPYSVGKTLGFSFVLNHPDYDGRSAGQLIADTKDLPEEVSFGGMMHSKQTPNIIGRTDSSGTAADYLRVADVLQEAVYDQHDIEMPLEVRVVS